MFMMMRLNSEKLYMLALKRGKTQALQRPFYWERQSPPVTTGHKGKYVTGHLKNKDPSSAWN